jgi:hypothetical protein
MEESMKALFISLFLCLSLSSNTFADTALSYEVARSEMSSRFQKQAVESLKRLRSGNFSDIDEEFKRFEQLIDAGVSLESIGTTKEEIYDIHLKYPSKPVRGTGLIETILNVIDSPAFKREKRWGDDKLRAQKSLDRMRKGKHIRDFDTELWDFEVFQESAGVSLAELGTSQSELKQLHKNYSCTVAKTLWRKQETGSIRPEESQELLYLLKEFGPC